MMLTNPFFNVYDSDPYYFYHKPIYRRQHQPSSYNQQRRRRYLQAAEEAQRHRAEAERRLQQAAHQEYLQRLQEEETYRRAYEVAKLEEAKQVQEYLFGNDHESDDDDEGKEAMEPVFQMMQGSNGILYKVKVGEKLRPQPNSQLQRSSIMRNQRNVMASPPQQDDRYQFVRYPEGKIYRVQRQPDKEEANLKPSWLSRLNDLNARSDQPDEESSEFVHGTSPLAPVRIPIRPSKPRKRSQNDKRKSKKTVTVVVEDASDSESEDGLQSLQRNSLVLSPGQWMEPVKTTY